MSDTCLGIILVITILACLVFIGIAETKTGMFFGE